MRRHVALFVLLGILVLAAGLRFYRLDAQSLWNDEGNSARIAERPLNLILEGAEGDIHPPGYYILLHYWRALFGQSEYALRSLSAVAGVGLVSFTYLLGHQAFGQATGLGAAFLAALAPLGVYYSQEARMYTLLGLFAAASTYLLLRVLAGPGRRPSGLLSPPAPSRRLPAMVAYVLVATAGLYVQYAFGLVMLAHSAIFFVWWIVACRRAPDRWRWLLAWIGAQVGILLLYLPWIRIALASVLGWPAAGLEYALGPAIIDSFKVLIAGVTIEAEQALRMLVVQGVFLAVGLVPDHHDRLEWFGVTATGLGLVVPISLIFVLDLYKPAWLKFLIVAMPQAAILVAHCVETRWVADAFDSPRRWEATAARIALFGVLGAALVPSLQNLYFDPAYARDDYRQIAADISGDWRAGDGIVLNAPNQWEAFTYYYPDQNVHPAPYLPDEGEVADFINTLTSRYRRLFVLYWGDDESDPQHHIERALAATAYKASDRWYGRVRLAKYALSALPDQPAVETDAELGGTIRMEGYAIPRGPYTSGEILPVTLFWQATEPVAHRYKVTLQLLDGTGQLVAQHDAEPGGGLAPTTAWEQGQMYVDRHGLLIGADLAPGAYTLIVALYDPATGSRLPVSLAGGQVGDYLALQLLDVSS